MTNPEVPTANQSLGLVEIDLMRRIQAKYVGRPGHVRRPVLNHLVFRKTLAPRANDVPILLPPESKGWVQDESRRLIEFASRDDVHLYGDPIELEISDRRFGESQWTGREAEERDAAVDVIVRLTDEVARLRRELLAANERLGAPPPEPGLGVTLRAAGTAEMGAIGHLRLALRPLSRQARVAKPSWVRRPNWFGGRATRGRYPARQR